MASTWPFGINVADPSHSKPEGMLPVGVHVPVAGLYSSPLVNGGLPLLAPPAASTFPLASTTRRNDSRATFILPVAVHVPVEGLYSSALVVMLLFASMRIR